MSNKEKFYGVNESNWGHKWGYKDSGFKVNSDKSVTFTGKRYPICGKKLYNFIFETEKMRLYNMKLLDFFEHLHF